MYVCISLVHLSLTAYPSKLGWMGSSKSSPYPPPLSHCMSMPPSQPQQCQSPPSLPSQKGKVKVHTYTFYLYHVVVMVPAHVLIFSHCLPSCPCFLATGSVYLNGKVKVHTHTHTHTPSLSTYLASCVMGMLLVTQPVSWEAMIRLPIHKCMHSHEMKPSPSSEVDEIITLEHCSM